MPSRMYPSVGPVLVFLACVLPAFLAAQPLEFPRDEGAHDSDFEVWSLLAHVDGDSGRALGVVTLFFTGKVSGLKVSGTYHLIADEQAGEWSGARDLVVPLFGKSERVRGRLDTSFDRSRLVGDTATGRITSTVRTGDTDLELIFDPEGGATDFGRMTVGPDAQQRIYVRARGPVSGQLEEAGVVEDLSGTGFFQHAWGDSPTAESAGSIFSVHLDDGTALVGYHGADSLSLHALSISGPGEEARVLSGFVAEPTEEERVVGTEEATYPMGWRLRTDGPAGVDLLLETATGGQPVDLLGTRYWIGRCRVTGTVGVRPVQGMAYVLIRGESPMASDEVKANRPDTAKAATPAPQKGRAAPPAKSRPPISGPIT